MASKTVILTGASRGIGLAIAQYLLRESHNVIVIARSKAPLEELRNQYPKQVRALPGDLADFSLAKEASDLAIREFGRLDGLIVNHGVLVPGRVAASDASEWKRTFDVNFFSALAFVQAALPALRKSKGRIIFISSGAAVKAFSTWGAYGSSKAAMNHLALTLSAEEPDVTTISLAPGVVDTQMQSEVRTNHVSLMDEKDATRFVELHRDGQLLKPEQPGNVISRLVLTAPEDLSGKFLRWNDAVLIDFQDSKKSL